MNNWIKCNDTELLEEQEIYSKLYDEHISDDGYERAYLVCKRFKLNERYGWIS